MNEGILCASMCVFIYLGTNIVRSCRLKLYSKFSLHVSIFYLIRMCCLHFLCLMCQYICLCEWKAFSFLFNVLFFIFVFYWLSFCHSLTFSPLNLHDYLQFPIFLLYWLNWVFLLFAHLFFLFVLNIVSPFVTTGCGSLISFV